MCSQPNVAILLTPPGPAAIAVVRIAGAGTGRFLRDYFSRPAKDGRCAHGTLRDEVGNVLDDPVVVWSDSRATADVNLHGGTWVVRSVLTLLGRAGFEIRDASMASVAYDGAGLLEQEMLEQLPAARTELALRTLLGQPDAWSGLRARLASATPEVAARELGAILADRSLANLLRTPRVAIVGAPNVGKSTLANQLFGQERSITADLPGTTRDWVGEIANVDGLAVMLVDTPGVRDTPDAIERQAIQRSRTEVERADLVILVLDASQPHTTIGLSPFPACADVLHVLNKIDFAVDQRPQGIGTAATTGHGVDRLRDAIRHHFNCFDVPLDRPRAWTGRQRQIVSRAVDAPSTLDEI